MVACAVTKTTTLDNLTTFLTDQGLSARRAQHGRICCDGRQWSDQSLLKARQNPMNIYYRIDVMLMALLNKVFHRRSTNRSDFYSDRVVAILMQRVAVFPAYLHYNLYCYFVCYCYYCYLIGWRHGLLPLLDSYPLNANVYRSECFVCNFCYYGYCLSGFSICWHCYCYHDCYQN